MKTFDTITDLIGNTPLLKLTNYITGKKLPATIYGKLEYFNPAGSVKDRVAKAMIEDAEAKGILKTGSVIIEPTCSGSIFQRIQNYSYNARNYEYGTPQSAKSIWCQARSDRRRKRHDRRH